MTPQYSMLLCQLVWHHQQTNYGSNWSVEVTNQYRYYGCDLVSWSGIIKTMDPVVQLKLQNHWRIMILLDQLKWHHRYGENGCYLVSQSTITRTMTTISVGQLTWHQECNVYLADVASPVQRLCIHLISWTNTASTVTMNASWSADVPSPR